MRNGYIIDTIKFVDIEEVVKVGREVVKSYEGVFSRENFKIGLFKEIIDKLLKSRLKYNDEEKQSSAAVSKVKNEFFIRTTDKKRF